MDLVTVLSLKNKDRAWQNTLSESVFLRQLRLLWQSVWLPYNNVALGSALQTVSFALMVILFACLTLARFANDKEGLALVALASFVIWLLGKLIGGKEKRTVFAIDALVISYGCLNIIAAFSSHYFYESLKGLAKVLIYLASYFLLTAQLYQRPLRKLLLITILVISATAAALYGLYQYKIGVPPLATWEIPILKIQQSGFTPRLTILICWLAIWLPLYL